MDFQLGTEQKYWTCVLNLLRLTLLAPWVFVLTRSTKGRRIEMDPYYLKNNKCYRLEIFRGVREYLLRSKKFYNDITASVWLPWQLLDKTALKTSNFQMLPEMTIIKIKVPNFIQ